MRKWSLLLLFFWLCVPATLAQNSTHPRLWLTPDSLTLYRSWATDANPMYTEALLPMAEQAKQDMDAGLIASGDLGGYSYEDYNTENYAVLFAFMSLIHADEAQRADYAQRARTLLMRVMTEADKGAASGEPFRDPYFALSDRSRWYGVSFPLTVDWIYPVLSADDKAMIRRVFLRWMAELTVADTTTMNHPEPVGIYNDPQLISDIDAVRWSGNNYYTAHMRNMGMMALALDPVDDPDGALGVYLQQATGAWLYVHDHLLRTDAAGGFGTEGFEYSPQSVGYAAQFLLALHTAGVDDPAQYGQQVSFTTNPFWEDVFKAYFHSLSPATTENPDYGEQVYEPAFYGSGQVYFNPDHIELFGALGVYDLLTNDAEGLNAARWLQTHTPVGGADDLVGRGNDAQEIYKNLLYFMLFDPAASAPTDPRPAYPTTWYAPGMRRLLSRTDWSASAAWFTYALSWNRVDHQTGNGNAIEFYRDGEWLTKVHVGYDLDYISSDHLNTLTVQNDPIDRDDFRLMLWERGSQWLYSANNPPQPVYSDAPDYLYAYGDSTNLYNTDYEDLHGVTHVSRSLVWLKPDVIVVYDRALTQSVTSIKRFMLNFPADATVTDRLVTMTTAQGQQFFITSLLPADGVITVSEWQDEASSAPAGYEPMRYKLEVMPPAGTEVRFLHVLQGADAGAGALPADNIVSADSDYQGAVVGDTVVLFQVVVGEPAAAVSYEAPAAIQRHVITGLAPNTEYAAAVTISGNAMQVTITPTPSTGILTDTAGVLWLNAPN
jgi:hypothetical protein